MAVANTKSTAITNADALIAGTASTRTPVYLDGGRVRAKVFTVETAAADDAGSVYRLARLPSNALVLMIRIACDAITNMSTADLGLYDIASVNSGAVVDVDHFASAVDVSSALTLYATTNWMAEADATEIDRIEKLIWERLYTEGIITTNADPQKEYDLCLTATTNDPSAAATISGFVLYTVD